MTGSVLINSENLRKGMNSIIKRMHNGETLDDVINDISDGYYTDTANFEARFIKGTDDSGDSASLNYVCDFMNYMNEIDKREGKDRTFGANGSVLFDFETDFGSPLNFDRPDPASVLQPLDDENEEFQRWARSTVSSEETSAMPDAAKESDGAATAVTAAATETTGTTEVSAETEAAAEAAPASDENVGSETPESASEGSSSASSPVTEEAVAEPAPEAAPVEVEVAAPSTAVAAEPVESEEAPATEEAIEEEASAEAATTPSE